MFAGLTILILGQMATLASPASPSPFTFLTDELHSCPGAAPPSPRVQLCLLNAVVPNSCRMASMPSFRGYEMWCPFRYHALSHAAHHISEALAWRTVQT